VALGVAVCEYVCEECGVVFMRDTVCRVVLTEEKQARILRRAERAAHWHVRGERLRLFIVRWVCPLVREYRQFCTFIGTLVVTLALVAGLFVWSDADCGPYAPCW
jgi:hypothetical protein